jgi:enterochelin esterase family protein
MKTSPLLLLFALIAISVSCQKEEVNPKPTPEPDYRAFTSFRDFNATLENLLSQPDISQQRIDDFLDSLKENQLIPFVMNDSVAFLYRGDVSSVAWAGDFNGWNPAAAGYQGEKIAESNIFRMTQSYPHDARLDYKIVVNGNSWNLDPSNPLVQYSGFGPNSELRMPGWVFPAETVLQAGVVRGTLSENNVIQSIPWNLNYDVQYKVYTPYNYAAQSNLPVIYVTDGHEYANDRMGAMVIVLDNLIYQGQIQPVIAVFIDPRNPSNPGQNRRIQEYRANILFARFVAQELVPVVDAAYKTNRAANQRAILGTSLGGWNSAYFGLTFPDVFGLIAIHSPAFDSNIINNYATALLLPLKIYMSTGVINDTQFQARSMRTVMNEKGYPLLYKEVNEGHSWGNWRALIDEPLLYFFGS